MRRGELVQHQPAKEHREHAHRQEEARFGRDPRGAIGREPAARHDHVQVRMMGHRRAPGVEDRGDPDPRAEVLRVGRDRQQGRGRRLEEQIVDHRLVLVSDVGDRGRQGEHEVEVRHGQELGFALRQPVPGGGSLALRAVAVAAAVVSDLGVVAVLTSRDMATKSRGAAAHDGRHHLELAEADVTGVGAPPRGPVVAEDVRDLQSGTGHEPRALCRGLGPSGDQGRQAIERAHDPADRVGGHPRVDRGGVELGVA
jgi:hypothetical protein